MLTMVSTAVEVKFGRSLVECQRERKHIQNFLLLCAKCAVNDDGGVTKPLSGGSTNVTQVPCGHFLFPTVQAKCKGKETL